MEKAYKFRIYPNDKQEKLINKTFGCVRFVYNRYLNKRIEVYKDTKENFSFNKCSADLTALKKELEWLKEVDKFSLQNSLRDLDNAYKKFFKEGSGFPKFKSKKTSRLSYRTSFTNKNIDYVNGYIKLPKLGLIKTRDKHVLEGRILNATVSKSPSGKYFVSICSTDIEFNQLNKTGNSIGLDLGITDFCSLSNGEIVKNPKHLQKSLKKLAKLQRGLSRKSIGSSNRNKARLKVARLSEHISNQRKDFLHKLSKRLVVENDVICIENLNIKSMLKNKQLSRSVSDVSWYEFTRQLDYKSRWYGKKVIKVDMYFASSQICSGCGHKNPITKDLSVREWTCTECNTHHHRDINASINILNEGLRLLEV